MAEDYELPADLLDAQRAYYQADAEVQRVTDALPPGPIPGDRREELDAARAERGRLIDVLYGHPWWETVEDKNAARMQLQKMARG